MEVVINKCYGGFGLSALAIKEYIKLKGKKAYFYKQTKYSFKDKVNEFTRITPVEGLSVYILYTFTRDCGKKFTKFPDDKYYFSWSDIKRDDKDLVKVIKKLGDKANGVCAKLKIVDVPNHISWEIDNYDGMESIEETHMSWR